MSHNGYMRLGYVTRHANFDPKKVMVKFNQVIDSLYLEDEITTKWVMIKHIFAVRNIYLYIYVYIYISEF